ncbi:MAG: hypothetical protein ACKPKO_35955, partial [Candidatus Fonsibacter sp.]
MKENEILWFTEVHDARRELKNMSTRHEAIEDQWKIEVSELRQECSLYSRELKEGSVYFHKQEEMAMHFESQAKTWTEESRL